MTSPSSQVTHEVISHDIGRATVADISLKYHRKFRRYHRTPAPRNIWWQWIIVQTYPALTLSPMLFFHPLLLCRLFVQRKSGHISRVLCCSVVLDGSTIDCCHGCNNFFKMVFYVGKSCIVSKPKPLQTILKISRMQVNIRPLKVFGKKHKLSTART